LIYTFQCASQQVAQIQKGLSPRHEVDDDHQRLGGRRDLKLFEASSCENGVAILRYEIQK
jgi:hypothetical protein